MCLGIPGEIVTFDTESPDLAVADVSGVRRTINVALLLDEDLHVGDWVLIHVGFAMSKIDETEARRSLDMLLATGPAGDDELVALYESKWT